MPRRTSRPQLPPKTPHADLANDVWQRYSNSGTRPANPPSVPLRLFTAEKRNSLNLSPLGLRRSYSCGPDWPPVKLKKRKTGSIEPSTPEVEEEDFANVIEGSETVRQPIVPLRRREGKSKMSRVSMLLNKVHKKLAKDSTPPGHPSSSPPPNLASEICDVPSSPTRTAISRRVHQSTVTPIKKIHAKQNVSDNEDYGDDYDDEIDLEMIKRVEEVAVAFTQQQEQRKKVDGKREIMDDIQDQNTFAQADSDSDEFDCGDDDNALNGIDIDNLISQVPMSTKPKAEPARKLQKLPAVTSYKKLPPQNVASVLEEFNDIDFGEWDDEDLDSVVRITIIFMGGSPNCLKADINSGTVRRFVVLASSEGTWECRGKSRTQKV